MTLHPEIESVTRLAELMQLAGLMCERRISLGADNPETLRNIGFSESSPSGKFSRIDSGDAEIIMKASSFANLKRNIQLDESNICAKTPSPPADRGASACNEKS